MKRVSEGPILTTVFVDYDNIYLSLKRKNEDAAKRFAKESGVWLQALVSGELITQTSALAPVAERRFVMTRCYGNPAPRRNAHDNSTDMNSFPFVRHHFLRSGFEVIDCPPLTAQLKNSADIRMVMDIRDILTHDTYFDEVIILSGDADFTPLLHRLRAHARRTAIYVNDHTAQPYTAVSDGEIREANLLNLLLSGRASLSASPTRELAAPQAAQPIIDIDAARKAVLTEVVSFVRSAPQAVPLETLADRAVRMVGRDKAIGTNWGGYGSFRDLLLAGLPDDIHLSDTAPYTVFDANRHISQIGLVAAPQIQAQVPVHTAPAPQLAPQQRRSFEAAPAARAAQFAPLQYAASPPDAAPVQTQMPTAAYEQPREKPRAPQVPQHAAMPPPAAAPAPPRRDAEHATKIQQSIARIHEACQAPALAPAEYRVLFDVLAQEITANGLQGAQTLSNVTQRAREFGLEVKRDDLRFVVDVVSESDPWFEQGASANLFAGRFRNYVVSRCRAQGLNLSADELDLVEAWFAAQPAPPRKAYGTAPAPAQAPPPAAPPAPPGGERWWSLEEGRQYIAEQRSQGSYGGDEQAEEEFPRIVRRRLG